MKMSLCYNLTQSIMFGIVSFEMNSFTMNWKIGSSELKIKITFSAIEKSVIINENYLRSRTKVKSIKSLVKFPNQRNSSVFWIFFNLIASFIPPFYVQRVMINISRTQWERDKKAILSTCRNPVISFSDYLWASWNPYGCVRNYSFGLCIRRHD